MPWFACHQPYDTRMVNSTGRCGPSHLACRAYVVTREQVAMFNATLDNYLSRLHDANVAVRRGYAQAVGTLPAWVLRPQAEEVGELPCCLGAPLTAPFIVAWHVQLSTCQRPTGPTIPMPCG